MTLNLFDLDDLDTEVGVTGRPERRSPKRQRHPWVIRGGVGGRMWYGGQCRGIEDRPRWRLWGKDALRFSTLSEASDVARRVGGTVEGRP